MTLSFTSMIAMIFLVAIPLGSLPAIVFLVKEFEIKRQRWILFREAIIALSIALFFLFLGEKFLSAIFVQQYSISLAGGLLLFLISMKMLFHVHSETARSKTPSQEPFVVPIATPFISGGGLLATILILAKQAPLTTVALALSIAWIPLTLYIVTAVHVQKLLGKRGLIIVEQLMGMVLIMLSIELITNGLHTFLNQATVVQNDSINRFLIEK